MIPRYRFGFITRQFFVQIRQLDGKEMGNLFSRVEFLILAQVHFLALVAQFKSFIVCNYNDRLRDLPSQIVSALRFLHLCDLEIALQTNTWFYHFL